MPVGRTSPARTSSSPTPASGRCPFSPRAPRARSPAPTSSTTTPPGAPSPAAAHGRGTRDAARRGGWPDLHRRRQAHHLPQPRPARRWTSVYKKLGRDAPRRASTDKVPLPGGAVGDFAAFAADFKVTSGLTDVLAERLLRLYGVRAPDVLEEAGDDPSLRVLALPLPRASRPASWGARSSTPSGGRWPRPWPTRSSGAPWSASGPNVALDVDEAAARLPSNTSAGARSGRRTRSKHFRRVRRALQAEELQGGRARRGLGQGIADRDQQSRGAVGCPPFTFMRGAPG